MLVETVQILEFMVLHHLEHYGQLAVAVVVLQQVVVVVDNRVWLEVLAEAVRVKRQVRVVHQMVEREHQVKEIMVAQEEVIMLIFDMLEVEVVLYILTELLVEAVVVMRLMEH